MMFSLLLFLFLMKFLIINLNNGLVLMYKVVNTKKSDEEEEIIELEEYEKTLEPGNIVFQQNMIKNTNQLP